MTPRSSTRYALFQLHQDAACAEGHAIPAKGLTGGYNGHTFWDAEILLLPVLTYCEPQHVEAALRWRASTLPPATSVSCTSTPWPAAG